MPIKIKRVYEPAQKSDGFRILADRLWPRGLSKSKAKIDLWLKDIAPSSKLRKWFGHDPKRFSEFKKRYSRELKSAKEHLKMLKLKSKHATITLLYGAKDEQHNNAAVLKNLLSK